MVMLIEKSQTWQVNRLIGAPIPANFMQCKENHKNNSHSTILATWKQFEISRKKLVGPHYSRRPANLFWRKPANLKRAVTEWQNFIAAIPRTLINKKSKEAPQREKRIIRPQVNGLQRRKLCGSHPKTHTPKKLR